MLFYVQKGKIEILRLEPQTLRTLTAVPDHYAKRAIDLKIPDFLRPIIPHPMYI
jgi:hypothetical protein